MGIKLTAPFPVEQIHWRVGRLTQKKDKATALAYLDARDVMERLDLAVGPSGWQCRYPFPGCCEIGIHSESQGWLWKANGADESDIEGVKGQFSGAFKRAAVLWGIGRYLYDMKRSAQSWYPVNEYKQFTPEAIAQLNKEYEAFIKPLLRAVA